MTHAVTLDKPPAETSPGPDFPIHPSDILLNLIVAFLVPMFLSTSGGDIAFARMAAVETINAYRARNHVDLIAIAQVIACSLSALGSLGLAMADNLSLSMTLRLRGNAVALNRAADQNRRALRESHSIDADPHPTGAPDGFAFTTDPDEALYEAKVLADVAAAQKLTAEAQARLQITEPPATPAPIPTPAPAAAPEMTEQQWHAMWASAMTDVAGEFTADLRNLPPAERRLASLRAAALSSCANQLISGEVPPAPRPGDLDAFIRRAQPENPRAGR
jgi:hypothetical protein